MTAKITFTHALRRAQAEAAGRLLAKGHVVVKGEDGAVLVRCRIGEKFAAGARGERLVFDPLERATVIAKGRPATCEFVANDGTTVLGLGLAGDHPGAVARFAEGYLFEGMRLDFIEPLVIELPPTQPAKE